jgi:acyl-CoA reductase-like NAD-dependent aldehyde dehydrogenase
MADRLEVLKTYKTYVGGKFPRSESERYYKIRDRKENVIANACRCTRKDFRNAMVSARSAFDGWSSRSAYNRGQILYRIAEMLEGRKEQFVSELEKTGMKPKEAKLEVEASVDRLIYYAGWSDKFQQVFGTINPVASSHFNFSLPDPTGVISILAPESHPLLGLVTCVAPVITGGNTCVILASESNPLPAINFGEVLHASDVPAGVVNILSGFQEELADHITSHMDVNAILNASENKTIRKQIDENAALNVKRVKHYMPGDWLADESESPYLLMDFQEIKTTWHPVGF